MRSLAFSFFSTLFFVSQALAQTTVSFQDGSAGYSGTEDTFVHEKFPANNFGSATILKADGADGAAPSGEVATLVKWDVSSIPAGSTVTAATVSLEFYNTSSGVYDVLAQNSAWTEAAAVWASLNSGAQVGTIPPASGGVRNIALNAAGLAAVQNWIGNAANNHGIAIRTAGSNDGIAARSSESSAYHPKLTVTYTTGGPPTIEQLLARIQTLEALLAGASRNGNTLKLEGMNLQIVNGLGATDGDQGSGPQVNSLGNLIVGYNEPPSECTGLQCFVLRLGSHNLIVGPEHSYTSYGGIVGGSHNTISGASATVSGGESNEADSLAATVSGGTGNVASFSYSSVTGGQNNTASGFNSSISGGLSNTASGDFSSVSGGGGNEAMGFMSSVSGGQNNTASHLGSVVVGGNGNTTSGTDDIAP